ncbi:YeeE/YedE thiosulfate transporter family protein [Sphingopyxis witflariensis]|uniref:Uncharacterized protein n=1 Tax=Sphingopyxis witflariensis TaxID=173675 RepID=A0A246JZK7_9SPHN|nr:YeeE/YedE thiosulfate transporter family protein [Sphingopyxis witflariensis]OWQ98453.1 hypothetical protein CDQ91_08230 [Sphingopyxis witflariensis]
MNAIAVAVAASVLSFAMGFAIRRGTVCVVVAAQDLVVRRRPDRFIGFATAACWSGLLIVPLAWAAPAVFHLSPGYDQLIQALLFGGLFGIGAWANQACGLGTLAHLTGGRLGYLLTLLGWVIGASLVSKVYRSQQMPAPSLLETSPLAAIAAWLAFAAVCWWSWPRLRLLRHPSRWRRIMLGRARMRPFEAMLIIGVGGGLLYACAGNWTYLSLLSSYASQIVMRDFTPSSPLPALLGTAMMVAGGLFAAVRSSSFRLRGTNFRQGSRHLAGGTVMGAATQLIPGGNGVIIVYGLPSFAPHALTAYFGMTLTLTLIFAFTNYSRRA